MKDTDQKPGLRLLVVKHQRTATVSLTGVPATVSVTSAEEDLGDGLEVGLVTVLVGPDRQGNSSEYVDLLPVIVGRAPTQRHREGVGECLLGVSSGGQTQGLDVPWQRGCI